MSNRKQSASLGLGWNKFSQENYLEVGDVCVFELINRSAIRFNVVIFRHIKDTNSSPSLGQLPFMNASIVNIHIQIRKLTLLSVVVMQMQETTSN